MCTRVRTNFDFIREVGLFRSFVSFFVGRDGEASADCLFVCTHHGRTCASIAGACRQATKTSQLYCVCIIHCGGKCQISLHARPLSVGRGLLARNTMSSWPLRTTRPGLPVVWGDAFLPAPLLLLSSHPLSPLLCPRTRLSTPSARICFTKNYPSLKSNARQINTPTTQNGRRESTCARVYLLSFSWSATTFYFRDLDRFRDPNMHRGRDKLNKRLAFQEMPPNTRKPLGEERLSREGDSESKGRGGFEPSPAPEPGNTTQTTSHSYHSRTVPPPHPPLVREVHQPLSSTT